MEFFDWMGIPQFFLDFFSVRCETSQEVVDTLSLQLYICIGVAAGLFLIGQIFCGVGLYRLAKRAGYKYPWLGFIPVACTWLSGKLAGEASFFGQKMKRAGLYAALLEVLYICLQIFVLVLNFLTLKAGYYIFDQNQSGGGTWKLNRAAMGSMSWLCDAVFYCDMINYVVWLLVAVFFFVLYTAFFRKYYARNPFLMTFLCVIVPARGFVIFAVRNNRPIDYQAYMRRRMEEYARRNAPYGGNGGYGNYNGGQGYGGNAPQGGSPFSDFGDDRGQSGGQSGGGQSGNSGGGQDDPFSDF